VVQRSRLATIVARQDCADQGTPPINLKNRISAPPWRRPRRLCPGPADRSIAWLMVANWVVLRLKGGRGPGNPVPAASAAQLCPGDRLVPEADASDRRLLAPRGQRPARSAEQLDTAAPGLDQDALLPMKQK
jgi:hypothetical protein